MEYKRTALYAEHQALGAKLVPFAGYEMPIQYTGISLEHEAVRRQAGLFDVSHMGEFMVKGPQAEALLQRITSNDVARLSDGKAQYSCLTNPAGGILDDLLVYRIQAETFMLVVNASNIEKDWSWIQDVNKAEGYDASLQDISERTALIALQGPLATEILQTLSTSDFNSLSYYTFTRAVVAGLSNVLVSATGYTGSGGYELYLDNKGAVHLWKSLLEAGRPYGLMPAGLGARDTLRLEMGYCLYGNDLSEETTPLEAGLSWITKLSKEFTGVGRLREQKLTGPSRRLVGFIMQSRGIPRQGYSIMNKEGEVVGTVTSGTHSPSMGVGIGMGYIAAALAIPEQEIAISIRGQAQPATITTLPIYKK